MKRLISIMIITLLYAISLNSSVWSQIATIDEARIIAQNWIDLIIQKKGSWGETKSAVLEDIYEFMHDDRVLGYFCKVMPKGYIIVSLRKELAPVKAYSATCNLYPECTEGMVAILKQKMRRIQYKIEQKVGLIETAQTEDVAKIVEINYQKTWENIKNKRINLKKSHIPEESKTNYQEGDYLLTSSWHQGYPYNDFCPDLGCSNTPNGKAFVGCVATAGAQLMRYWNWPPHGSGSPYNDPYDWSNMPDSINASASRIQYDAVAELCSEVGKAVDMDYGCNGSSAYIYCWWAGCESLEKAFHERFRYQDIIDKKDRNYDSSSEWFNRIKGEINRNRPVIYGITGHALVADGWQIVGNIKQYHLNLGWGGGKPNKQCWQSMGHTNTWYTLHEIPCSDQDKEEILVKIVPDGIVGSTIAGTYSVRSFPYRYFDRDASGSNATFLAGQSIQFLHEITITGTGTSSSPIRFQGTTSSNTSLFSRGDQSKGVLIKGGAINLYNQGTIKFF